MVFAEWHPVTEDFGLVHAPVAKVVDELRAWHGDIGITYTHSEITESLEAGFKALLPLSNGKRRWLVVNTRSGWTACFQNGIQGSDPSPPMTVLAVRLNVLAMRVCSTPPGAMWPGVAWEVYATEQLGGEPVTASRRAICALNDGGRWRFFESGAPYDFEETGAYAARQKKDRFTHQMLERYLSHFGLFPFVDDFYDVQSCSPAVMLERPPRQNEPPDFTLEEVKLGKPWQRE